MSEDIRKILGLDEKTNVTALIRSELYSNEPSVSFNFLYFLREKKSTNCEIQFDDVRLLDYTLLLFYKLLTISGRSSRVERTKLLFI